RSSSQGFYLSYGGLLAFKLGFSLSIRLKTAGNGRRSLQFMRQP
ncbi:MAG: hypothetical protein ACI97B_001420, partial [Verrucomicrobiales bacterium]